MYAGGVLKRVDGLTYDKLIYFVRAGYVKPRKIKSQSLYYNDFSEEDVEVIKRAWELISKHKVKIKKLLKGQGRKVKAFNLSLI